MDANEFKKKFPTYDLYRDAVVAALVKSFGGHLSYFFEKRHTYETQYAERKSTDEVVEHFRKDYGS